MKPNEFEKAKETPQGIFGSPEGVLRSTTFADEQKIEILRRWEYQASEEAVALEEGMPGEESDLLRRILIALGQLTGPIDVEQTAPSKQHGLPRAAIKKSE